MCLDLSPACTVDILKHYSNADMPSVINGIFISESILFDGQINL